MENESHWAVRRYNHLYDIYIILFSASVSLTNISKDSRHYININIICKYKIISLKLTIIDH